MACNMPEPCKFPSLDSCQKKFGTHSEADLAAHPVVGLVLQDGGEMEKFPHALGFEILDLFSESASRVLVSEL